MALHLLDQAPRPGRNGVPGGRPDRAHGRLAITVNFSMEGEEDRLWRLMAFTTSAAYVVEESGSNPREVLRPAISHQEDVTAQYRAAKSVRQNGATRSNTVVNLPQAGPDVAVRYRLVTENGEPVVRMAFLCDNAQSTCARDRKFLKKGLPFARAR